MSDSGWIDVVNPNIDYYSDIQSRFPKAVMTSGYRTPEYQDDMRRRGYHPADDSSHLDGDSVDIVGIPHSVLQQAYPDAHFLDEGDHVHATFKGYGKFPALGNAVKFGVVNPNLAPAPAAAPSNDGWVDVDPKTVSSTPNDGWVNVDPKNIPSPVTPKMGLTDTVPVAPGAFDVSTSHEAGADTVQSTAAVAQSTQAINNMRASGASYEDIMKSPYAKVISPKDAEALKWYWSPAGKHTPIQWTAPAGMQNAHDKEEAAYEAQQPQQSTVGALGRGAIAGVIPAVTGAAGAGGGAALGAELGALGGPAAPLSVPVMALAGGLLGAFGGGTFGDTANDAIATGADKIDPNIRSNLGMSDEDLQRDAEQHPYATMIGRSLPGFLVARPGFSADGMGRLPGVGGKIGQVASGAGINAGIEAAQEYSNDGTLDPTKVAIAAGIGALQTKNTALGNHLMGHEASPSISDTGPGISIPTAEKRRSTEYRQQIAQTTQDIADRINHLTQDWKNAPQYEVHPNFSKLGLPHQAIGAIHDGKVVINAEAVVKEAARRDVSPDTVVNAVTYHEGLGHHGLSQLFGEALDTKLSTILDHSPVYQKRVQEWLNKNPKYYEGDPNRDIRALDEILAEKSEKGKMPASFTNILSNVVKDFGRKMGLDLKYSTREVETILGMAHSATVDGGHFLASKRGMTGPRYMYGGVSAQEADFNGLNKMLNTHAAYGHGTEPGSDIHKRTGWFVGPDGHPRFEFPDDEAKLTEHFDNLPETGSLSVPTSIKLDKALDHPELFEQYPHLKDINVIKKHGFLDFGGLQGYYDHKNSTINVTPYAKDPIGTILHEIQHAIQDHEGFARGGNTNTALEKMPPEKLENLGKTVAEDMRMRVEEQDALIRIFNQVIETPEAAELKSAYEIWSKGYDTQNKALREAGTDAMLEAEKALAKRLFGVEYNFEIPQELHSTWYDLRKALKGNWDEKLGEMISQRDDLQQLSDRLENPGSHNNLVTLLSKAPGDHAYKAYRGLFGEVEARDTAERRKMTDYERDEKTPYRTEANPVHPSDYIFDMTGGENSQDHSRESANDNTIDLAEVRKRKQLKEFASDLAEKVRDRAVELHTAIKDLRENGNLPFEVGTRFTTAKGRELGQGPWKVTGYYMDPKNPERFGYRVERGVEGTDLESSHLLVSDPAADTRMKERNPEWDRDSEVASWKPMSGPSKFMMMSDPDKVDFTPEEIDKFSAEELIDSENAMHILNEMTKGYEPVVMSHEALQREAEARGITPSQILRNKNIGAGEITKRLYMYDIAIGKLNDRTSRLWEKINSGEYTPDDKANYLKTVFKIQELSGRIFDDQGEVGRALAAMKTITFTRRRVNGMRQTLAQFNKGSPFKELDDPDEFHRFAKAIQDQMEDKKQSTVSKAKEIVSNLINIPRAIMSSADLSAPLRQGLFLIHKPAWWSSFFHMFRFFGSDRAFTDLMEDIKNRDSYGLMLTGRLSLTDMHGRLASKEEAFMSNYAEHIPIVKNSERAYVGFLNKLRADTFDSLVKQLKRNEDGTYNEKDLKDIGSFVNNATGRGDLGKTMNSAAPLLNGMFFSPRLIASRLKMGTVLFDPRTYLSMNPVARREYIKALIAVGSLALTVTSLAKAGGAQVEDDPRSSDFGKIRTGNTRYDILGGEGQYITLAARFASGSYKTIDGKVQKYGNKFGQKNFLQETEGFGEKKLAPVPSFVADFLRGTDVVGNKFQLSTATMNRLVPMVVTDTYDAIQQNGGKGAVMAVPGLFGVGVQSFSKPSLDTSKPLEASDSFKMKDLDNGSYNNKGYDYTVQDGEVTLGDKAQALWTKTINQYYRQYVKEEMAKPEWRSMSDKDKAAVIADAKRDARKEAKLDMLDVLDPGASAPANTSNNGWVDVK